MTTTQTRPMVDEWAGRHYPPQPTRPAMTLPELAEASRRLSGLRDLVGVQADEVMALLTVLLCERDEASMRILRWLRSLDEAARS